MEAITEQVEPKTIAELGATIADRASRQQPIYFVGGGTSLDYGWVPTEPGVGIRLASMNRIVEYNPRDMTVIAEAGVTLSQLNETLRGEKQYLPIDVPDPEQSTLGGVAATNWSGPRRAGMGTMRDYVIGITGVDGRGNEYKGGGKVVKNVAGYDFCKMLIGSMGQLGAIARLTLKVNPLPEQSQTLVIDAEDLEAFDQLLLAMIDLPAPPVAVDLLRGPAWSEVLSSCGIAVSTSPAVGVVRIEGTGSEVESLAEKIEAVASQVKLGKSVRLRGEQESRLFQEQVGFARSGVRGAVAAEQEKVPLAIRAAVRPSQALPLVSMFAASDNQLSLQLHAASGVLDARFSTFDAEDFTQQLIGRWRPAAIQSGGSLVVLESQYAPLSHQIVWGPGPAAGKISARMIEAFDPQGICNPGRLIPVNQLQSVE